jgi:hypothetical protein
MTEDESDQKTAEITSEAKFTLHGCILDREHLEQIWQVACEGFPEHARISVATERTNSGISSKITSDSISGTMDGVRKAARAGDPNSIDNLTLRASSGTYGDDQKYISIGIDNESVRVSVEGGDPEWVRGRAGRLRELLNSERNKLSFLGPYPGSTVGGAGLLISAVAGGLAEFYSFNHLPRFSTSTFPLVLAIGIFLGGTAGAGLLGVWVGKKARTRLFLTHEDSKSQRIDKMSVALLIATIIGIVIAVFALLVAHYDATHSLPTSLYQYNQYKRAL